MSKSRFSVQNSKSQLQFQGLDPSKRPKQSFHDALRFQNYTFHDFNIDCDQENFCFFGFMPKKRDF